MTEVEQGEAKAIALELSRVVGANYKVYEPSKEFPPSQSRAVWIVRCVDLANARRAFHADAIWKEGQNIFVETRAVGSVSEWVRLDYGESAATRVHKMDLTDFDRPEVRTPFEEKFPKVGRHLKRIERKLGEISSKYHVSLRVRSDGGKGIAKFYLQAKAPGGGLESEIGQIKACEAALRKAVQGIDEL